PQAAHGQFIKKLKDTAKQAAEEEALVGVDQLVRGQVQCVFNDFECMKGAEESGEGYVLTDSDGEVLFDDSGQPVSDPYQAADMLGEEPPQGFADTDEAVSTFEFVPGENVLFEEDYLSSNLGDFPRPLRFLNGNMEVVEWNGGRWIKATAGSAFAVQLQSILPQKFTLEFPVYYGHGNQWMRVIFRDPEGKTVQPRGMGWYTWAHLQIDERNTGIQDIDQDGPFSLTRAEFTDAPATIQMMADGDHVKVFVDQVRVANVPQVDLGRSNLVHFVIADAAEDKPIFVGPIRIAGGGRDLYDVLASEGRFTTRGILFDVNSATIRFESAPTLNEIGQMLQNHPDLRLSIEGHTDGDGDEAHNQALSEQRAEAVRNHLVLSFGIDPSRLEAVGHGETIPVAPNDTEEGKQQNRRVELVRL
ncbi:MAG: OmpA family protein, partial [Rhodothermales bacterium]|nr:OmpA family protein [Rhodothermales bacterium]